MYKPTPLALRRRAVDLYRKGWSMREIGDAIGTSHNAVRKYVHAAGLVLRPSGGAYVDTPPTSEIADLYARFRSLDVVADICGVSRGTIRNRLRAVAGEGGAPS